MIEFLAEQEYHAPSGIFSGDGARTRSYVFSETSGVIGASFTAATLIDMIDLPIDIATFYDGQPINLFCTIFDRFGLPTKQFYAFDAFGRLRQSGERVTLDHDVPGVYALATACDDSLCVMAANWEGRTGSYNVEILGLDPEINYRYALYLLDEEHNLDRVTEITGKPTDLPQTLYLHKNSVVLIRIDRQ